MLDSGSSTRSQFFVELLDEMARARGRTQSAFRNEHVESGLSELEMVVLNAVAGARQPPTVPQIGRSLGHARQVIQRAAGALIGRGLITPVGNPAHKRAHRLTLTASGASLKEVADRRGLALAERLTMGMDPALITMTVAGLRAIRERLEENLRAANTRTRSGEQ